MRSQREGRLDECQNCVAVYTSASSLPHHEGACTSGLYFYLERRIEKSTAHEALRTRYIRGCCHEANARACLCPRCSSSTWISTAAVISSKHVHRSLGRTGHKRRTWTDQDYSISLVWGQASCFPFYSPPVLERLEAGQRWSVRVQQRRVKMQRYQKLEKIGEGTYGVVYKVCQTGTTCFCVAHETDRTFFRKAVHES